LGGTGLGGAGLAVAGEEGVGLDGVVTGLVGVVIALPTPHIPTSKARTAIAEPFRMAQRRYCIVIGTSFPSLYLDPEWRTQHFHLSMMQIIPSLPQN